MGEQVREYGRIYGLTKKKLAEKLGIDISTLAGWESEDEPTKRMLVKLEMVSDSDKRRAYYGKEKIMLRVPPRRELNPQGPFGPPDF